MFRISTEQSRLFADAAINVWRLGMEKVGN
jgi:hypothetical protein